MTKKNCINNCVWGRDMFPDIKKCPVCREPMVAQAATARKNHIRPVITEKTCNECNTLLPIIEFGKQWSAKDGYRYKCRTCINRIQLKYHHNRKKNKSK